MPTSDVLIFDCLVIGGGIAGAGVARDAAIRGLRTLLIDENDFASGTSHVTSKLIHGGLRYLDQGKVRLALESVVERDRLLHRLAPGLVVPQRFVIPFEGQRFLKWLITAAGIQAYGLIELCRSGRLCRPLLGGAILATHPKLLPHPFGICFWDARSNDARLVMAALRSAQSHGATIRNYVTVHSARLGADGWQMELHVDGRRRTVQARAIVNATGPWCALTASALGVPTVAPTWIKGSHLVVRRPPTFPDDVVVIRSVRDERYLWVVPWESRLVVGTTERRFDGDLRQVRPEPDELEDLWESFLHYYPAAKSENWDICGTYAGVRPIASQHGGNTNEMSRRHQIVVDRERRMVTIMGGKLTTFRLAAEEAVDQIVRLLGQPPPTRALRRKLRRTPLWPGLCRDEQTRLVAQLQTGGIRGMRSEIAQHLVTRYGADAVEFLGRIHKSDFSTPFGALPYSIEELEYVCRTERVYHLADLLKRRTSLFFLAERAGLDIVQSYGARLAAALEWPKEKFEAELESALADFEDYRSIANLRTIAPRT